MRDGDMLRINSHTTWRVRQLARRWMRETSLKATDPTSAFDGMAVNDVWRLARRTYQWLINPGRELPTGMTLAQLAGDDLPEYQANADDILSMFGVQAEDRGVPSGFKRTAAHGGLACSHWWGHPHWPIRVDRFMKALDNPADDHWGPRGEHRTALSAAPPDVGDRAYLRRLLLSRPWDLSTDAAQWLVRAGICYVTVS